MMLVVEYLMRTSLYFCPTTCRTNRFGSLYCYGLTDFIPVSLPGEAEGDAPADAAVNETTKRTASKNPDVLFSFSNVLFLIYPTLQTFVKFDLILDVSHIL